MIWSLWETWSLNPDLCSDIKQGQRQLVNNQSNAKGLQLLQGRLSLKLLLIQQQPSIAYGQAYNKQHNERRSNQCRFAKSPDTISKEGTKDSEKISSCTPRTLNKHRHQHQHPIPDLAAKRGESVIIEMSLLTHQHSPLQISSLSFYETNLL